MSPIDHIKRRIQITKKDLNVTTLEHDAWKVSDNLEKTIHYLSKTDLKETVRRKMIRDMLKDNLINFYKQQSNTKETTPTAS